MRLTLLLWVLGWGVRMEYSLLKLSLPGITPRVLGGIWQQVPWRGTQLGWLLQTLPDNPIGVLRKQVEKMDSEEESPKEETLPKYGQLQGCNRKQGGAGPASPLGVAPLLLCLPPAQWLRAEGLITSQG